MTKPKPIHRLEETLGGVRVVTKALSNLYDYRSANVLKREYSALFTSCVPKKGGPKRVRIASAARFGAATEWQIYGVNGIYAEVSLTERELSAAECAYCDEHIMYQDTEPVVEFSIPHPEELRAAVLKNNAFPTSCFEAIIEDSDRRHDMLTDLQERIETEV
ncbi:hypothetical protein [Natrinema soli]|uniref:Uncharacterized protein n=1 Tax=Natrinema soli TaxID=1930624 RepID=A0ABD5SKG9_9EURY|nr:hypothetical protein [Natrinema soli]